MKRDFNVERFEDCSYDELVAYCKAMKRENESLRGQIADLIDGNISNGIDCLEAIEECELCKRELASVRADYFSLLERFGTVYREAGNRAAL